MSDGGQHPDDPEPAAWAPPSGPAAADPDPNDASELTPPAAPAAPAAVTAIDGDPPVVGGAWTVRARTAAGVSGLSVEVDGRPQNVSMRPEPGPGGGPPVWTGTVPEVEAGPLRYRFVWRSSWNGGVTEWHHVTPAPAEP